MTDIHKISKGFANYLSEIYNIDFENDPNISIQSFNENTCLARLSKRSSDYVSNYGFFTSYQCNCSKFNGTDLCELHLSKYLENKLSLGKINEEPPEEPFIYDLLGNKTRIYWIQDSPREKLKEYVEDQNEFERQENYKKKSRGRPPLPQIRFELIDFKKMSDENTLEKLNIQSLKNYLKTTNLNIYGKKNDLILRIQDHINKLPPNISL
jgi:hypothetical protein